MSRESIRQRLAAATPGPLERETWGYRDLDDQADHVRRNLALQYSGEVTATDMTWVSEGERFIALIGNGPKQTENGDLIAHAPTDLAALLAVADAAAAALATTLTYDSGMCVDCGQWVRPGDEPGTHVEGFCTVLDLQTALAALEAADA
jgi:hypothetical protein